MRIERKKSSITFGDLHNGDTFEYDNTLFMKTKDYKSLSINAVNMHTGELHCLTVHGFVVKVNGKFVED